MRPLWTGDVADGSPGLVVGRLLRGFARSALLASTAPAGLWRFASARVSVCHYRASSRFASARVSVCHSRASRSVLKVLRSVLRLGRQGRAPGHPHLRSPSAPRGPLLGNPGNRRIATTMYCDGR